jgi:hypothetical protein
VIFVEQLNMNVERTAHLPSSTTMTVTTTVILAVSGVGRRCRIVQAVEAILGDERLLPAATVLEIGA